MVVSSLVLYVFRDGAPTADSVLLFGELVMML